MLSQLNVIQKATELSNLLNYGSYVYFYYYHCHCYHYFIIIISLIRKRFFNVIFANIYEYCEAAIQLYL